MTKDCKKEEVRQTDDDEWGWTGSSDRSADGCVYRACVSGPAVILSVVAPGLSGSYEVMFN